MRPALVIIIAYLMGSIPFGYLIVRLTEGGDIRATGSGGTGATNVSRRAGKAAGVVTLLLDALKGAAAVVVASWVLDIPLWHSYPGLHLKVFANSDLSFQQAYWCIAGAAIAAIIGHMLPVWLGFRGGKGVATGVGVFLVLAPGAVAFAGLIFILIVWITRYVSLGSIIAAVTIPLFVWLQNLIVPSLEFAPVITAATVAALLIIFAHRGNIGRLMQGNESKFG
ncbi:MAG: glycerol-3-phosphate 1-O-acyltransferase PlsY [Acidobacteriota bacterium]|nr:glycerol-3-phosphate 1-O-acyltransferase PlsY [Acidobacteriota bacterium]